MADALRTLERRLARAELTNLRTAAAELARRVDELEAALEQANDRVYYAESMAETWHNIAERENLRIDRAVRIADTAAEELIRSEGRAASGPDEFLIASDAADEHMRDCIDHLCVRGRAIQTETDDGDIVVQIAPESPR